jgi:hypothetical protein
MSTPNKRVKAAGCLNCNPCLDQNGIVTCHGGQLQVWPWPTTGGPYIVTIDPTSETPVQYADGPTITPGIPPTV